MRKEIGKQHIAIRLGDAVSMRVGSSVQAFRYRLNAGAHLFGNARGGV